MNADKQICGCEPDSQYVELAVEVFAMLADATRVRMILALRDGELSVNHLADIVDKTPALDVAVLDVNLGSETSEAIARRLLDSGVPFVVVTGYSSEQLPSTLASGLLIPKPIDHAKLLSALKRLIDANKRDAVTIAEMPLSSNGVDGGAPGNR